MHTSHTRPGPHLVTVGETMGRFSAGAIGTLDFVPTFTIGLAGAESNVAIAAARLGAAAVWVGRVGQDSVGDLVERRIRAEGVRTVAVRDSGPTGLMVVSRRTSAGTRVDYHRTGSAGSHLRSEDVLEDVLTGAGIVHLTGITPALSEQAREATFAIAAAGRAAGALVSVDVNYRSKLWDQQSAAPVLAELLASADIAFAGPEEAQLVLGTDESDSLELARLVRGLGPREVVVKDGPRGCVAVLDDPDGGGEHRVPAIEVEAIDPVGAGDAFVGGYLADRLLGVPGGQRLDTAVRTGAYAVTVPGDCEGLPSRADLDSISTAEDVAR